MNHHAVAGQTGGRIMAVALIVAAIALAIATSQISYAFSSDPLGPRFFPYALALALGLCAIWYLVSPGAADAPPDRIGVLNLVGAAVLSVVTVGLMPYLGFLISMGVLASGLAWLFNGTPPLALLSGFGQSALWWFVFEKLLGSNLPRGPLGF